MSSTGTRKPRDVQSRASDAIIESDKELINEFKVFAESSNSVAGLAGGAVNNSPKTPAGNYLAREGDSMIGPLALGPPLNFRVVIDANNTIDIGPLSDNAQYSSNIELDSIQPNSFVLDIIANANFDGQILIMRTFGPDSFTISQATLANGGNIQTPTDEDFTLDALQMIILVFDEALQVFANTGGTWRVLTSGGGTGGVGTFISADMTADQITNIAVGNHVEYDRNATPTGADGGIVLQTGVGQANGIFELLAGKTYYLSAAPNPTIISPNNVEFAWFDITNANELGRRLVVNNLVTLANQPKLEIIYTPATDVTVEVRIVNVTTPGFFTAIQSAYTFASIYEFSGKNGAAGTPGADGAPTWKLPARAKSTEDVTSFVSTSVIFDGITLVEDDRVLLTNQTDQAENGLWQVGTVTTGTAPLTRPTDFDTSAEVLSETFVAIEEGSQFANQLYHLISNNPLTIDVTDQVWEQFAPETDFDIPGTGQDGKDATGTFILDGRMFAAIDKLKILEQDFGNVAPTYSINDLLYIPPDDSVFNNEQLSGNLITCGRMDQTPITTTGSISKDYGTTWTAVQIGGAGLAPGGTQFAYDPVGDVAICIVSGGTLDSQRIRRSTDKGVTWGSTAYAGGINIGYVIWSVRLSLFIGLTAALTNSIFTSPDGNTWTNRTTAAGTPDPPAIQVTWNVMDDAPGIEGTAGKVVVIADRSLDILTSTDGITWILESMGDVAGGTSFTFQQTPTQLIWAEGQQQFLMKPPTSSTDTEGIFLSPDGKNWIQHLLPNQGVGVLEGIKQFRWMAEYSIWIGIGLGPINHQIFWISTNGIDWTLAPDVAFRRKDVDITLTATFFVGNPRALAYSPEFGYIFGVGNVQRTSGSSNFDGNRIWRTQVFFNNAIGSS